ncbi:MAG TPA: hypothetical protein VMA97_05100 [Streptosporangiaceae bacterium]|nr:hypothetical protein [Streptosporangiaceae bacterium]
MRPSKHGGRLARRLALPELGETMTSVTFGSSGRTEATPQTRMIQRGGFVAIAVDEASGTVTGTGLVDVAGDGPAVGELAAVGALTPVWCCPLREALLLVRLRSGQVGLTS